MFFGNTLLKGCALDWHGTFILNMKEVLSMFMTTVINIHSIMTFLMQISVMTT